MRATSALKFSGLDCNLVTKIPQGWLVRRGLKLSQQCLERFAVMGFVVGATPGMGY